MTAITLCHGNPITFLIKPPEKERGLLQSEEQKALPTEYTICKSVILRLQSKIHSLGFLVKLSFCDIGSCCDTHKTLGKFSYSEDTGHCMVSTTSALQKAKKGHHIKIWIPDNFML